MKGFLFACFAFSIALHAELPTTAIMVKALKPLQKDVAIVRSFPAEIIPSHKASIASEWVGPIVAIHVDDFDSVQKGQVLAEIDTQLLDLQIQEAEAQLDFAKKQWTRFQGLHDKKAITEQALIEVERNFKVADATLKRLQVQKEKAWIKAPWEGTVQKKRIEVGDYVVQGQPMFDLIDTNQYKVRAIIPGSEVTHLSVGEKASIKFENGLLPFETHISKISPVIDPNSRSLEIETLINHPNGQIRTGMVATLELALEQIDNALCIPLSSLMEFEDGQGVYIAKGDKAVQKSVKPGEVVDTYQVILEGLQPDDLVIVEGQHQISSGTQISLTNPQ